MDHTKPSRRSPASTVPRSPLLHRSVTGDSPTSLPDSRRSLTPQSSPRLSVTRPSRSATSSPRPSVERPRSTIKIRTTTSTTTTTTPRLQKLKQVNPELPELRLSRSTLLPSISSPKIPLPITTNGDDNSGSRSLRKPSPHNLSIRRVRSTLTGSPSAWALSPGRPFPLPPSSPSSPSPMSLSTSPSLDSSLKSRSLIGSSVLKYFQRQKKTSPDDELGFHHYRMLYNRLLQWRFANAKSEASLCILSKKAEERLFAVWLKVCKMRNSIAEKRSRVERLRLKIKLLGIVCPQLQLLNEWEFVDKRNSEAVSRVAMKLSAFSMKLPLVHGAKVDIIDLYEAMCSAMEVLQDIEMNITKFLYQAEETCYILTELINTMGEHDKCFQELGMEIYTIVSLEAEEKSLRTNVMQAGKEVWERQNSCKYHRFISFGRRANANANANASANANATSGIVTFNPLFSLLNVS